MKYLLDTNVVSELRKGPRADPGVMAWRAGIDAAAAFLSVIVLAELHYGVVRLRKRDPSQASHLGRWLDRVRSEFQDRTLGIDEDTALIWAEITPEQPKSAGDGLVAATAIRHDLTVVTRNVRHFEDTGASWLNPFSA